MMADVKFKMSRERLDEIREELLYLETVREKEVSEQIKEARSFGDLSENSEYDEAKTEQGKLYSKIAELKNVLENSEVIEKSENTNGVVLGSRIKVECLEDGEHEEYQIVGSQEANPMTGRISDDSPFGRALLGHAIGDTVAVEAPVGTINYKIITIQNKHS
ncbi:MAG: transcription elongation factor GreA [Oscillospiraceae bacterium]